MIAAYFACSGMLPATVVGEVTAAVVEEVTAALAVRTVVHDDAPAKSRHILPMKIRSSREMQLS